MNDVDENEEEEEEEEGSSQERTLDFVNSFVNLLKIQRKCKKCSFAEGTREKIKAKNERKGQELKQM